MGNFISNQAVVLSGGLSDYITLNTLFGAIVVLAVLILIMIITFIVSVRPLLNGNTSVQASESGVPGAVFEQIARQEEAELVDDTELVAVITAAIHAYRGDAVPTVPADGFVVRSIRKAGRTRLLNA